MSEITKKALVSSLIALCDEKKLNKITVQDIVNKCGVNRNTFYYHSRIYMICLIICLEMNMSM